MADSDRRKRKERVIHTRVSADLDDALKKRSSRLGVTVSNMVRNVLMNTFGLVEEAISDGAEVARAAAGEPEPVPSVGGATEGVIGWQPLVLELNAVCARCNHILPRGSDAAIAVGGPLPHAVICPTCLQELRDASGTQ